MKNFLNKGFTQALNFTKSRNLVSGFTLLEAIIVIAIIGIIVAVAFPQLSKVKNVQILKSSSEDIISILNKARSQTLASLNSQHYGVRFEPNSIIIFTSDSYNAGDASNEIINISSPASISNISLSGGASEFYFNRLTGAPTRTGTITVSIATDASLTKTITISATGGVSMN